MDEQSDVVWLTWGIDWGEGEFISRMRLPTDAFRTTLEADGSQLEGGEDRMYEVWAVERD